jgi:hypothetical protein
MSNETKHVGEDLWAEGEPAHRAAQAIAERTDA